MKKDRPVIATKHRIQALHYLAGCADQCANDLRNDDGFRLACAELKGMFNEVADIVRVNAAKKTRKKRTKPCCRECAYSLNDGTGAITGLTVLWCMFHAGYFPAKHTCRDAIKKSEGLIVGGGKRNKETGVVS